MVKLIGVSGSLRQGSFNSSLLRAAAGLMPEGAELRIATIRGIPLYDADVEAAQGIPTAVVALKDRIAADGLLLATPEYNNSIPGAADGSLTDPKVRGALREFLVGYMAFVVSTRRARP